MGFLEGHPFGDERCFTLSRLAEIRSQALDILNGGRLFFGIERDQLKSTLHENIAASQADGFDEDGQE